jgi:ABC-type glycerol-3-phosphate transport system substrate-binding protein
MRRQARFSRGRLAVVLLVVVGIVLLLGVPGLVGGQTAPGSTCSTAPENVVRTVAVHDNPDAIMRFDPAARAAASPGIDVSAEAFGRPLAEDDIARLNARPSVFLQQGDSVRFTLTVPETGEYTLAFDVAVPEDVRQAEGELRIDGAFPAEDFRRVQFPVFYRGNESTFPRDRYGNEALIRQTRVVLWATAPLRDIEFSQPYPVRLQLTAGEHDIEFALTQGSLYLGRFTATPFAPYPGYDAYLAAQTAPVSGDFLFSFEAEQPAFKNDSALRPVNNRDLTVTPYDTYCLLLNTLGGESWVQSGTAAFYEITVPQDGLYAITVRALQNTRSNFTVFRRVTINGEVAFAELNAVPFPYAAGWQDVTLGGETPWLIHLREGVNVLGLEATNSPYQPAIDTIRQALLDINALALEINRLTGNQRDPFKEWDVADYIPDIEPRIEAIAQRLIDDKSTLEAIDRSGNSPEILTYQMAIDNLLFLAAEPNQIPNHMTRFSEGTGSAAQQLGSLLPLLQEQPLTLDRVYIHSPERTPQTAFVPITTSLGEDLKRFIHSFEPDPYASIGAETSELEVWVNRPRQFVDLMQLMADASFTPETGIQVKFSIMPDESKLVLANAADIQPDMALGVSTNVPYELAIRNALLDLRSFPDFDSFIHIYSPGALLGYIIDDAVYAVPETQDFWVTFYREDILNSLGLPVPRTWPEVIEILPELQRYGMNYNTPLSGGTGTRGYLFTAPYLFNYGAPLYTDDGFATGLGSDEAVAAVRFMADSFTIYGMPLTTSSFFEGFRYGTLPVGISNAETYIKLLTAAPELAGLWNIAPYPATVLPDGTENRYATGSAQTGLIFRNTDQPDAAWEFLKWWMSSETQSEFQDQLLLSYGTEYLWFSANVEAFSRLPIPQEHREVILEQWQWLQEPVRLPGSYMQERELSNVWNRIVFDGENPRAAIDRAITIINREISRKMEEFGYLQDGVRVRDFHIPTIDTVRGWMESAQ